MHSSEVNTFPHVLDGGAYVDHTVPQLESHSMRSSEVSTFPRVLDGGAHAGLTVPQLESHSMHSSVFNTFPRVLDGGAHAGLTVPQSPIACTQVYSTHSHASWTEAHMLALLCLT